MNAFKTKIITMVPGEYYVGFTNRLGAFCFRYDSKTESGLIFGDRVVDMRTNTVMSDEFSLISSISEFDFLIKATDSSINKYIKNRFNELHNQEG